MCGPLREKSDVEPSDVSDVESASDNGCPIGVAGSPRLQAKAKRQRKAAKNAAKAARKREREKFEQEKANLARGGRAAKRAMQNA